MQHITNFIQGMDKDSSDEFISPQSYRHLENGDITAAEGEGVGVLTNIKGNAVTTVIWPSDVNTALSPYSRPASEPFGATYSLIKLVKINDDIVEFYAHTNDGSTIICILKYNSAGTYTRIIITGDKMNAVTPTYTLAIGLLPTTKLNIAFRYEHDGLIKVYYSNKDLSSAILDQLQYINVAPDTANGVVKDAFLQASYRKYDTIPVPGMGANGLKERLDDLEAPSAYPYEGGSLRSGAYQYAFRYVNNGGNKTPWSDLSNMVYVTNEPMSQTTRELKGATSIGSISSGKQIFVDIQGTKTALIDDYDYIEVARLWFSAIGTVPACYLIKRMKASNAADSFYDSDYSEVIATLNVNDFLNLTTLYSPKTSANKDDRLFAGNIREDSFDIDFDARVFRFDSTQVSRVCSEYDTEYYVIDHADLVNDINAIPLDHDLVNNSNLLSNDFDPTKNGYKFQSDGTTLGAEGIYVKIECTFSDLTLDNLNSPGYWGADTEPNVLGMNKQFQMDEIYRLGLVFEDDYGRTTPVKYMTDFRMPSHYDVYGAAATDLRDKVKVINLTVTVNATGTEAEGLRWRLVMVPREANDRTVITQGLVTPLFHPSMPAISDYCGSGFLVDAYASEDGGGTCTGTISGSGNTHLSAASAMGIVTPEVLFNQNTRFDGCRLDFLGYVHAYYDRWWTNKDTGEACEPILFKHARMKEFYFNDLTDSNFVGDIEEDQLVKSGAYGLVNGILIEPEILAAVETAGSINTQRWYGNACTTHYMKVTNFNLGATKDEDHIAFCNVRKDIVQYGGRSYEARLNNIYVPALGDTFVGMFEYQRIQRPLDDPDADDDVSTAPFWHRIAETVVVPVESSINLPFRYDDTFNNLTLGSVLGCEAMQVREEGRTTVHVCNTSAYYKTLAGATVLDGTETVAAQKYVAWTPLYKQETVYSLIDLTQKYATLDVDYLKSEIFRNRVRYTEAKLNGELYDNWLSFLPLNFKDTEAAYGQINFMINFNDEILVFQDTSVDQLIINPTVQMQADDGTNMIMGTGEVLHDIKYLDTSVGIQNYNEAFASPSYLYWLDNNRKKIYQLSNGLHSLGDEKKMSSLFNNTIQLNTLLLGAYDTDKKAMLLSVLNFTGNYYERNLFTVTTSTSSYIILTGDANLLQLRVGNKIYITTTTGTYPGTYTVYSINSTAVRLNRTATIPLPNVPILAEVDLSIHLKYKESYTIKFDEQLQVFKGFDPFLPIHLMAMPKSLISVAESGSTLYTHNIGNKGTFYGRTYPLMLDFVANEGRALNKSFGALEIENDAIIDNKDFTDTLDYTGVENVTFDAVRIIGNREITEFIELYPKDGKIIEGGTAPNYTGNIHANTYTTAVRSLLDTNGLRHDSFPIYLYNVRQTLNKFLMILPRFRTGKIDTYGRVKTELIRGTSATVRLLYYNSTQALLRVRNIITHFNTSINA